MKRSALADLPARVDLVIVGGGITGAGLLQEAARTGASVLLVEQGDFAAGTSSGSSKLVHGGLRYLKTGQWRLTLESVRERQHLLQDLPGLVVRQPFLMPIYRGAKPGRTTMRVGLWLYDRMGSASGSRWIEAAEALRLEPALRSENLLGAMLYEDARTDDARLTLRCIFDALGARVIARNYTRVENLLRSGGRVRGVAVRDALDGSTREIEAAMVILAAGAWSQQLAGADAPRLRPLRGSHFVFAKERLPVTRAVSWLHPRDRRPIFAYPWEGATLYGTTDVDHFDADLSRPRMSAQESDYLMQGLHHQFPALKLEARDALSRYSAVRPVVAGGKADPSAESRESATWSEPGLVGLAGGKLTTFRVAARGLLAKASKQHPVLAPVEPSAPSAASAAAPKRPAGPSQGEAALRHAARHEHVVNLDDLLLRRTRAGIVMAEGARSLLPLAKTICQSELGWTDAQWTAQEQRYLKLWREDHAPTAQALEAAA